ncbi:MAG: hypothetical protein QXY84_03880 [Candidatus Caldarchaeum sp.]
MNKWILLVAYVVFGVVMLSAAYVFDIYVLELAVGYLSRAQSTGYAEDMASYVSKALDFLPKEGNPVWIFPTTRTDYALIRQDLTTIVERLQTVASVPRENPAYPQTLHDIRGKIAVLVHQIYETMPYVFFKPVNIVAAIIYLITPLIIRKAAARHRNRQSRNSVTVHKRAA